MKWLIFLLIHLFNPKAATPSTEVLCGRVEVASAEEVTCDDVADWLESLGYRREAMRLRMEISNGF